MSAVVRGILDRHYMAHQHALGDVVTAKAIALQSLSPPSEHADLLIQSLYHQAVALGSRYYDLASVAHGYHVFNHFPDLRLDPDHIVNAMEASDNIPGALHTLVLSGARDVVIQASALDPNAEGWDRFAEPGACQYCRDQTGDGPKFPAHYNCECVAAPRFR